MLQKKCKGEEGAKRRKTTRAPSRRSIRNEGKNKDYTEPGNEVMMGEDAGDVAEIWTGVRCEMGLRWLTLDTLESGQIGEM